LDERLVADLKAIRETLLRAFLAVNSELMVLSVFAPLSSASCGHRRQHSSCCQDSKDNRGFPHVPLMPHCGGNVFTHSGPAL